MLLLGTFAIAKGCRFTTSQTSEASMTRKESTPNAPWN